MKTLSPDTSPEAEKLWIELIRKQTPEQKLAQVIRLNNRARTFQLAGVRLRHPDADVPLDLNGILAAIYDEAGYDLTIDYSAPPPAPSLDEESTTWLEQQLSAIRA